MKGLKKQRRIQVIVIAVIAMIAAFGTFYIAAPDALQFFRSPSEIAESPPPPNEVFRIGGLVEEGAQGSAHERGLSASLRTDKNQNSVRNAIPSHGISQH